MSECAIKAEHISKRYQIGSRENYKTLRDALKDWALEPFRRIKRFGRSSRGKENAIWALRDINFEVSRGEVLGVIGPNGAGKSTLLKILSGITEPTQGRAVINGRVGSLLEVGTGFHQELTGRENIYLSGAILGMCKAEIDRKFDQIVAFSGVEDFIDTPVKRYSSGMRVRLGFAVAAHLDPKVLLIDEVLAVGDAKFQKKCLGKIDDVASSGRTIIFVSHNMESVSRLCSRVLLLKRGRATTFDNAEDAIDEYLGTPGGADQGRVDLRQASGIDQQRDAILTSVSICGTDGELHTTFYTGQSLRINIGYEVPDTMRSAYFAVHIKNSRQQRIMSLFSHHGREEPFVLQGSGAVVCELDDLRLVSGNYTVDLAVGTRSPLPQPKDYIPNAVHFKVRLGDYLNGGVLRKTQGVIAQRSRWHAKDTAFSGEGEARI